jgi:hypothetical protein
MSNVSCFKFIFSLLLLLSPRSLFSKDFQPFHVKATFEASRNQQELKAPDQNAFLLLKVIPQYTFENKWSIGINQGARQRIEPARVWNWADSALFTLSPSYGLSEKISFRSLISLLYPTSDFSRRDLQMRWGMGATNYFTWKFSGGSEWAVQSFEYVLKITKKFYAYKTDVSGESVSEWLLFHALELNCMTFEKLGWSLAFSGDSELKSSGRIQNSFSVSTTLSYEIFPASAVYFTLSNAGFSDGTQERFGRLGKFDSRDTDLTLGMLLSF